MKHLKKFEELDYSTYASAANKLSGFGQEDKARELITHAGKMSKVETGALIFNVMVGPRSFPSAKLESMEVYRSGEDLKTNQTWTLQAILKSGDNTHRVSSNVSNSGEITWKDGNKFGDKRSVFNFQKAVISYAKFQPDFVRFLSENNLTSEDLKLVLRTFYL